MGVVAKAVGEERRKGMKESTPKRAKARVRKEPLSGVVSRGREESVSVDWRLGLLLDDLIRG